MIYRIRPDQQDKFINMPETGMGYQIIEASRRGSYFMHRYIILNSEIAIELDGDENKEIKKIIDAGIQKTEVAAPIIEFNAIILYSERESQTILREPKSHYLRGAIENPQEQAHGTENLVRLSAFKDDRRIDAHNKCLRPGSFTTSLEDLQKCQDGNDNPSERYALPTHDQVEWVFHIHPSQRDEFQPGTVQAAFGKRGGGKEYYFEKGTSKNTYKPPAKSIHDKQ